MEDLSFRALREMNGLSIDETAEFLEMNPKTIRRWEAGETKPKKAYIEMLKHRLEGRCFSISI